MRPTPDHGDTAAEDAVQSADHAARVSSGDYVSRDELMSDSYRDAFRRALRKRGLILANTGDAYRVEVAEPWKIEERVAGKTPWQSEPSGARFADRASAERAIARLEPTNEDGDTLEYRIVEA